MDWKICASRTTIATFGTKVGRLREVMYTLHVYPRCELIFVSSRKLSYEDFLYLDENDMWRVYSSKQDNILAGLGASSSSEPWVLCHASDPGHC